MADIPSTPNESARIMRRLRCVPDTTERSIRLAAATIHAGSALIFRIDGSTSLDQDRIRPSSEMEADMRKVWGIAGSLRPESLSANTPTPASAQIVLRINWFDDRSYRYRDFSVRVAAYSASYEPRIATGHPCTLKIGDVVCGILDAYGMWKCMGAGMLFTENNWLARPESGGLWRP